MSGHVERAPGCNLAQHDPAPWTHQHDPAPWTHQHDPAPWTHQHDPAPWTLLPMCAPRARLAGHGVRFRVANEWRTYEEGHAMVSE